MLRSAIRGMRRVPRAFNPRYFATNLEGELACMSRYGAYNTHKDTLISRYPMTKAVCTIGPVSEDAETLQSLVTSGLRIMRINFSHATYEEATLRMKNLRRSKGIHGGSFNMRAVMLDTQGPEIRTGLFEGDEETKGRKPKLELKKGDSIILTIDDEYRYKGTTEKIWCSYKKLCTSVKVGSKILLDDGLVGLEVKSIGGDFVECEILNTGLLGERKGVNLPGAIVELPALTEKDMADIEFGIKNDIDFIAASFVRKAADVAEIEDFVKKIHSQHWPETHPLPGIISKIETQEALQNFNGIMEKSYGIMVARGDLGVEIPFENVALAQKEMIYRCNKMGKPVIVATQMLESMQGNPRPTRAEVSDVTNAVLDGADAVMLSGESANGNYPLESVQALGSIAAEADKHLAFLDEHRFDSKGRSTTVMSSYEGLAYSAVRASKEMGAACIIIMTSTGRTAKWLSKFRPSVPVMAYVKNAKLGRQLILHRGLHPMYFKKSGSEEGTDEAVRRAIQFGFCSVGDTVLILQSIENNGVYDVAMRIRKVGEDGGNIEGVKDGI